MVSTLDTPGTIFCRHSGCPRTFGSHERLTEDPDVAKQQPTLADTLDWYDQNADRFDALVVVVKSTLEGMLRQKGIPFLNVSGRRKSRESFKGKVTTKSYASPTDDVTDIAGLRIICYIESDVERACDAIDEFFSVHNDKSLNKSDELGVDRVGYRSIHFVCSLGTQREALPEFSDLNGLVFEIQVRTVLQHAWAEIEHDRNYKFGSTLPANLQRRLGILAGVLELADREFDSLAHDIDEYGEEVAVATKSGNLDVELTTSSMEEFVKRILAPSMLTHQITNTRQSNNVSNEVIEELRAMGIDTLAALNANLTNDFWKTVANDDTNATGLLRDLMIFINAEHYFEHAWDKHWHFTDPAGYERMVRIMGKDKVKHLFNEKGIRVENIE